MAEEKDVLGDEQEEGKGNEDGVEMDSETDKPSDRLEAVCQDKPKEFQNLVKEYGDLFPKALPGLPPHRQVYHTIRIQPGATPPNRLAYRLSVQGMEELLALGHIQPSCSPYSSPIIFLRKKEGTYRMVIDYRAVNKNAIRDRYPLPRIDDLINKLKVAKVFSSLDLLSGCHQVRLKVEDIPKIAFRTPFGLCEFLVLPFSLTNAPATFQRLRNEIIHDFIREDFLVVYLDVLLIFRHSHEKHFTHFRRFFDRLQEKELFAKLANVDSCGLNFAIWDTSSEGKS